jgi:hypothetical protein
MSGDPTIFSAESALRTRHTKRPGADRDGTRDDEHDAGDDPAVLEERSHLGTPS